MMLVTDQSGMVEDIGISIIQAVDTGVFCNLQVGDTFLDHAGNLCCKITDQPKGVDNCCVIRQCPDSKLEDRLCWLTGLAPVTRVALT